MCSPYIGTAIQVAGAAAQTYGSIKSAQFQAKQLKQEAKADEAAAVLRADDRNRRMKSLLAENLSRYSASGVDTSVGSPFDVSADTAGAFSREQFLDDYNTDRGVRTQKLQSKVAKQSGYTQATNSLFDLSANIASDYLND